MLLVSYSVSNPPKTIKPIADEWEWQYQGACRDVDPEIFFLEHGERAQVKRKRQEKALTICRACPVVAQCLDHALKVPEMYGVWGGTTADQRLVMLNKKDIHGRVAKP